jgi:hypothetical protein
MWTKALVAVVLAVPVGLIAADPKERSVEAYDSQTHGAIQVRGDMPDWFEMRRGGKAIGLVPKRLNGTWEVEPGEYEVVVNRTSREVKVEAGKKVVLATGTLVVEGDGLYWYPTVGEDKKVGVNRNTPALNSPLALFPNTYAAEVNVNTRAVRVADAAKVEASKMTVVKR